MATRKKQNSFSAEQKPESKEDDPLAAFGLKPEDIGLLAEKYLGPIMAKMAGEAAAKAVSDVTQSLPAIVDRMLTARLDQIAAEQIAKAGPSEGGGQGEGRHKAVIDTFASAIMQRMMGGGGGGLDMSSFQQMGAALGAVLGPVVNIWSAGVSQGLQAVNLAQRMGGGSGMTPEQIQQQVSQQVQGMMKTLIPEQQK